MEFLIPSAKFLLASNSGRPRCCGIHRTLCLKRLSWGTCCSCPEFYLISEYESTILELVFQMYDSNEMPFADRRIGYAVVPLPEIYDKALDGPWDSWLDLRPNFANDTVSGRMRATVHISSPATFAMEITLLGVGVAVTACSLFMGFYKWRGSSSSMKTA